MRNKEINRLKDLRRKLKQHSHKLLKMYRAEAIGIGYKHVSGKRTEEIAIIFFVKKKLSKDELKSRYTISTSKAIRISHGCKGSGCFS